MQIPTCSYILFSKTHTTSITTSSLPYTLTIPFQIRNISIVNIYLFPGDGRLITRFKLYGSLKRSRRGTVTRIYVQPSLAQVISTTKNFAEVR